MNRARAQGKSVNRARAEWIDGLEAHHIDLETQMAIWAIMNLYSFPL